MKKIIFFIIILFLQVIHSSPARSSENGGDPSSPNSFPPEITLKVDDYEEKITAKVISSWL
jgi:hypothetical protein